MFIRGIIQLVKKHNFAVKHLNFLHSPDVSVLSAFQNLDNICSISPKDGNRAQFSPLLLGVECESHQQKPLLPSEDRRRKCVSR